MFSDLIAEAATLWESLTQNHPFVDGSRRAAFAATFSFAKLNGVTLESDPLEAHAFTIGLYETNAMGFKALEAWLRDHTRSG